MDERDMSLYNDCTVGIKPLLWSHRDKGKQLIQCHISRRKDFKYQACIPQTEIKVGNSKVFIGTMGKMNAQFNYHRKTSFYVLSDFDSQRAIT